MITFMVLIENNRNKNSAWFKIVRNEMHTQLTPLLEYIYRRLVIILFRLLSYFFTNNVLSKMPQMSKSFCYVIRVGI